MSIHEGHRGRLKARYIREGGKNFAAHNLLELLLFYAIPRRDTNEIAHALLNRFGDVNGVLTAPVEELCKVKGVSESTAALIKLTGELGRRFYRDELADLRRFYTYDDIGDFLKQHYMGVRSEQVYAMFLTANGKLLRMQMMCEGNVSTVRMNMRAVLAEALSCNAAAVILAHNHPDGSVYPSSEDLTATKTLYELLYGNGIELVEHYVVAKNATTRILEQSLNQGKGGETSRLKQRFSLR